jgi:hypothetical protein
MSLADPSSIERRALLDAELSSPAEFARQNLAWAKDRGHDRVVWHFATQGVVGDLAAHPGLESIATALTRRGQATADGIAIELSTKRAPSAAATPLAAWWPSDAQLLALDTTRRPLIDALVSNGWRAPIWLTAFNVALEEPIGVRDLDSPLEDRVLPIVVSPDLQAMVDSRSRAINLTNGIHDSMAGPLIEAARQMIREMTATPEAVAVAALRGGWWPDRVPDLVKKLSPR